MQVKRKEVRKIAFFGPVSRFISETIQDWSMVDWRVQEDVGGTTYFYVQDESSTETNAVPASQVTSSSSRMRVINHNWSATKQRPHPQSVAEISRHSVLSGDRIRQCETSSDIVECDRSLLMLYFLVLHSVILVSMLHTDFTL